MKLIKPGDTDTIAIWATEAEKVEKLRYQKNYADKARDFILYNCQKAERYHYDGAAWVKIDSCTDPLVDVPPVDEEAVAKAAELATAQLEEIAANPKNELHDKHHGPDDTPDLAALVQQLVDGVNAATQGDPVPADIAATLPDLPPLTEPVEFVQGVSEPGKSLASGETKALEVSTQKADLGDGDADKSAK